MQKILAKELGRGNIDLSIRLWGILTTHKFDMGNIGQSDFNPAMNVGKPYKTILIIEKGEIIYIVNLINGSIYDFSADTIS